MRRTTCCVSASHSSEKILFACSFTNPCSPLLSCYLSTEESLYGKSHSLVSSHPVSVCFVETSTHRFCRCWIFSSLDESEEPPIPQPSQAQVLNLARRLTSSAENDLLQESLYDPSEEPPVPELGKNKVYNQKNCEEIARHVVHADNLPTQCNQFPTAVQYAKAHDKDRTSGHEILS